MDLRLRIRPSTRTLLATLLLSSLACSTQGPNEQGATTGTHITVTAGIPFQVRLQSIGPGEYLSPPSISSDAVRYLRVATVGPFVPAGVTQEFSFVALRPGRALVTFRHSDMSPAVIDTVTVR